MNRPRRSNPWNEVTGLVLIGAGLLLFLALVSYDRGDPPSWALLIHTQSPPNDPRHNLVGIVGALTGGYAYFFFGVASYLLAVLLLGLGLGKLFVRGFDLLGRLGWVLLNLICAACLAQFAPGMFSGWEDHFRVAGTEDGSAPGGWIGYWVGTRAFNEAFGTAGSLILLSVLYLGSLILVTGFHPVLFCRRCFERIARFLADRRERKLAAMDEQERMETESKELDRKARKLEKKLRKQKPPEPAEPPAPAPPEPKIIDAAAPAEPRRKPAEKPAPSTGLAGVHLENYILPDLDLLDEMDDETRQLTDKEELLRIQNIIIDTLQQFGIEAHAGDITKGPTITRYELYPAKGVRVDRITNLERDIARATKAERINILAPIPGKDTVGVELANANKIKVTLRELFDTDAWVNADARLPLALGKDVYGSVIVADLASMPHCLVAGTTGSGKSVCINAIIASLLFRYSPEELRFIMIDPKVVEMQIYNVLPHLVTPVVTDPKKVLLALRWVIDEMELRYRIFAKCGVRNIAGFNARPLPKTQAELDAERGEGSGAENGDDPAPDDGGDVPGAENAAAEDVDEEPPPIKVPRDDDLIIPDRMPYIVVIIDELADLMQTAPADVENAIARITQMARAAGIHLIVATQTPRADVVTGVIKANIPSRVAFQVASKIDSRVILDENGAEKLLGKGDMLYLPPGTSKLCRAQGVLVTDEEIKRIVDFVAGQSQPAFEASIHEKLTSETGGEEDVSEEDEELVTKCLEIIKQERKASTSMLQRRLRLGYTRAARVVDILEQRGVLGPKDGAKDREILVDLDTL